MYYIFLYQVYNLIIELVQSDVYWSVLLLEAWGTLPNSFNPPPTPVKDLYRMHWRCFNNIRTNVKMFGTPTFDVSTLSPSFRALIFSR